MLPALHFIVGERECRLWLLKMSFDGLASLDLCTYFVARENARDDISSKLNDTSSGAQCPAVLSVAALIAIVRGAIAWRIAGWHLDSDNREATGEEDSDQSC